MQLIVAIDSIASTDFFGMQSAGYLKRDRRLLNGSISDLVINWLSINGDKTQPSVHVMIIPQNQSKFKQCSIFYSENSENSFYRLVCKILLLIIIE